jgi:hypothetical protein
LEEFGDDLALTTIYQPDCSNADRPQSFHRFVNQTLLRQGSLTHAHHPDGGSGGERYLGQLKQQSAWGQALVRIMPEQGISRHEACTWMRHQLIVRTFIDRRMQLFARLTDNQIVQYY